MIIFGRRTKYFVPVVSSAMPTDVAALAFIGFTFIGCAMYIIIVIIDIQATIIFFIKI